VSSGSTMPMVNLDAAVEGRRKEAGLPSVTSATLSSSKPFTFDFSVEIRQHKQQTESLGPGGIEEISGGFRFVMELLPAFRAVVSRARVERRYQGARV
jgi:hypothetical protein